jgi:tRNA(Ile2) C34 agmatinyltransferase TiaS
MIDGSVCPECDGHVSTTNGTEYVCDDCGERYDVADLFLP